MKEIMSKSSPSTRMPTHGCIDWDPNDAYEQVFGKERPGRVRGLGIRRASGSKATSSSAPQVPSNYPQYVNYAQFIKEFEEFKAAFQNSLPSVYR
jgi:hypothetical protein